MMRDRKQLWGMLITDEENTKILCTTFATLVSLK